MSQQLNLFPRSALDSTESDANDRLADLTAELNAIDEVFAASSFYRNSHEFLKLLNFIAHFPNYSAFKIIQPSTAFCFTPKIHPYHMWQRPEPGPANSEDGLNLMQILC
jgi:hypothetical protein